MLICAIEILIIIIIKSNVHNRFSVMSAMQTFVYRIHKIRLCGAFSQQVENFIIDKYSNYNHFIVMLFSSQEIKF